MLRKQIDESNVRGAMLRMNLDNAHAELQRAQEQVRLLETQLSNLGHQYGTAGTHSMRDGLLSMDEAMRVQGCLITAWGIINDRIHPLPVTAGTASQPDGLCCEPGNNGTDLPPGTMLIDTGDAGCDLSSERDMSLSSCEGIPLPRDYPQLGIW